jgi:uncharacterized protein
MRELARYLLRVANKDRYSPRDVQRVAETIRKILGSRESASHFRVSTDALEFNVFAKSEGELDDRKRLLTKNQFKIVNMKLLDTPPKTVDKDEAFSEGVELFNEERFWECHESLEQAWHISKGVERDAIQSIILTAAAYVHYQKGEDEICLSILKRAKTRLASVRDYERIDLQGLEKNIDGILVSEKIRPFKLRMSRA